MRDEGRAGTYHILDPFLRFWHRWAAPNRALLEIGQRQAETLSESNNLPYIVAPVWEALARQHLLAASGRGESPSPCRRWDHGGRGAQIDVIGVNRDHRVVFGEACWRSTPVTTADLHALMEKGLLWLKGDTARWDVHYAFFARNVGQVEEAGLGEESVHLFTPDDVASVSA